MMVALVTLYNVPYAECPVCGSAPSILTRLKSPAGPALPRGKGSTAQSVKVQARGTMVTCQADITT